MKHNARTLFLAVLILAVLAYPPVCLAKYSPLPLFDMVGSSDLVLVGTIAEVADETFVMRIDTVVAGKHPGKTIEIARFRDWPCARRWTPYATSQRVLVCLADKTD